MPEKLPTLSASTLLRALFKRPARGASAGPIPTRYLLDRIDLEQVARYRSGLGFGGTRIPLTYYYLLAQRAHLATMLGAAFPFRLVGAIHVDNTLRAGVQPVTGRPLELATEVRIEPPSANGAVHAVLDTQATQDGQLVFACSSTYLVARGKRSGGGPRASATAAPALASVSAWRLSAASGRHYAALSGDWNPIHLWRWSARLMGLKAPIIHGMHTLGRACAELERAGGRPLARLDGRFRATIELGAEAALAASLADGRFTVGTGGRVAVEGEFAFDSSQPMQAAYPRS
ncbi:MaoC/PaaZ C-terminal domain-containing protein [Massilia sp. Bi118]|uniref:MaoC/PaaZ C-terminal domain-containing protein n=1 Tax=Massilia sp. Bi118 TaxID=2822346 RepID=UPI001E4AC8FC|nr:MaoC/PaaZ C-terminal domain-containing protein [Massilia sp. Bi118]